MPNTELSNLINPEVMATMISAKLPAQIKFTPFAKIDNTLAGQPGNTITIPSYEYIGDADDLAEGEKVGMSTLTTTTMEAKIKKAAKGVALTDESVLSAYGDPVGQTTSQLAKSIASKIDEDCIDALLETTLIHDDNANYIRYDGIVDAVGKLQEEEFDVPKVLFVHSEQVATLRKDEDFKDINKYPMQTVMNGTIGSIAGCQVVVSNRIRLNEDDTAYENIIVQTGSSEDDLAALSIYIKRGVLIETARDIEEFSTKVTASEHYVAALTNPSKVVKALFLK